MPATPPRSRTYAIEPSSLIAEIDARGAEVVVGEIASDEPTKAFVGARIAEGTPSWIVVATKLAAFGRAGLSRELAEAIAIAFQRSPSAVLRDAPPAFPIDHLCAGPDTNAFDTYDKASAELSRQVAIIRSISDRALVDRVADCLRSLERSRERLKRHWAIN